MGGMVARYTIERRHHVLLEKKRIESKGVDHTARVVLHVFGGGCYVLSSDRLVTFLSVFFFNDRGNDINWASFDIRHETEATLALLCRLAVGPQEYHGLSETRLLCVMCEVYPLCLRVITPLELDMFFTH